MNYGVIMSTKKYCVYSHTNLINGKIYIGLTSMKPEERWKNGAGYHIGTHFRNAIDKYGWDNFRHDIIKDNLTKEEAADLEIYYISFYNSNDRRFGYNMSSGGENGGGHPQSEETRRNISKNNGSRKGIKRTEESKRKMSEAKKGEKHPNYGKHLSDETKEKLSKAHRRNRNKIVYCVELDCTFNSLDEASKEIQCSKAAIVHCCKGKTKTCKGYHLEYVG